MKLERLKVIETPDEYLVVYNDNEWDWVAKFNTSWADAKSWADHMVEVYNSRISSTH